MDLKNYIVLYNVMQEPFYGWVPVLVCAVICASLAAAAIIEGGWLPWPTIALFTGLFVVIGGVILTFNWLHYSHTRDALLGGRARVIEGRVEAFIADDNFRHKTEEFTVNGVPFSLSRATLIFGFNDTVLSGGPNLSHRCVRIYYLDDDAPRRIVWLAIRRAGCPDEDIDPTASSEAN